MRLERAADEGSIDARERERGIEASAVNRRSSGGRGGWRRERAEPCAETRRRRKEMEAMPSSRTRVER